MAADIQEALECVIKLNCERVLTSGGDRTALDGAPVIRRMVEQAGDRIIVVPGQMKARDHITVMPSHL